MEENVGLMYLPCLPTRGIICYPGNEMALDVGRIKSINAVDVSNHNEKSYIALVSQVKPEVNTPNFDDMYKYGTICEVISTKRNSDKSLRILIRGIDKIRIESFNEENDCLFVTCEVVKDLEGDKNEEIALVRNLVKNVTSLNGKNMNVSSALVSKLNNTISAKEICYSVAQVLPVQLARKQEILEINNINDKLVKVMESIQEEETIVNIEKDIDKKLKEKLDNTQKEYYLREKMRTIKEELGDTSDEDKDDILEKIEKEPFPQNVKDKIKDEMKKLEMMQPTAPEASVIRNYIDWLVKTPWYQKTEDIEDISNVEKTLNDDHYGLEKPKERIIEYLAVKKLTSSLKAPIICFAGPPGTGKTSLALSIARALNRKYVKVSLGGVSDEAEIKGHRRTYIGSMPGRIIQGMKKAGVINPVFILDEIDKLGKDYKGDPSNALLEVLDPEQNKIFSDNFLEEPYDLSNVLFICTANYLENIPAPLLDRLEIIELSSYTEQEKLEIAKKYLIKKQIEQNGIKELTMDEETILYIIRCYTREAGVRQLERNIGSIARKLAVKSLKEENVNYLVTKKEVVEFLGKEIFDFGKKEKKDQVGVVTGLAYTQYGGDILPIEAVHFEGKGQLVITGNLGKVMSESCNIALGFVKANAKEFGIDPTLFEKSDIHIHAPEGAVPKDGPSAGVTIVTALVSCMSNKKVRSDIAMTGEVTLRGNVLPIGGLREKSISAHRSGIKEIFIPKDNEKNIDDIPESVRKDLKIHLVSHVSEIIKEVIIDDSKEC